VCPEERESQKNSKLRPKCSRRVNAANASSTPAFSASYSAEERTLCSESENAKSGDQYSSSGSRSSIRRWLSFCMHLVIRSMASARFVHQCESTDIVFGARVGDFEHFISKLSEGARIFVAPFVLLPTALHPMHLKFQNQKPGVIPLRQKQCALSPQWSEKNGETITMPDAQTMRVVRTSNVSRQGL
jgi:hypothetical protein